MISQLHDLDKYRITSVSWLEVKQKVHACAARSYRHHQQTDETTFVQTATNIVE